VLRLTYKRLLHIVPLLFLLSIAAFGLLRLAPGDPAEIEAGMGAPPWQVEQIRIERSLDKPLWDQYTNWLTRAVQGDLGVSWSSRLPVTEIIAKRLPATVQLMALALLLSIVFGLALGVIAALTEGRLPDDAVRVAATISLSLPNFVVGIMFVLAFGWYFPGILPYSGYVPFTTDPLGAVRHSILPASAIAVTEIGLISRLTRSGMLEVLNDDYVLVARAFGLREREIITRFVLRNSLIPVITVIGLIGGTLLGGAVITETVFGIPGVGQLLVQSFQSRDYPVTTGVILEMATAFLMVNLLVDLGYGFLTPKIRRGLHS
jgi:peptide/nickel transport system permease protein